MQTPSGWVQFSVGVRLGRIAASAGGESEWEKVLAHTRHSVGGLGEEEEEAGGVTIVAGGTGSALLGPALAGSWVDRLAVALPVWALASAGFGLPSAPFSWIRVLAVASSQVTAEVISAG